LKRKKKVWKKYKGLLFPSKWCFSKICFFCLPQAEKAEKAQISKHDIFLMELGPLGTVNVRQTRRHGPPFL
jgi:hypothetical protein